MWRAGLILVLGLAGCAAPITSFVPYVVDVSDQAILDHDKDQCRQIAEAYKPGIDLGTILNQAGQGATQNAADGVLSPYVPLVGAAGGAATAGLQALGLNSQSQVRVYLRCLSNRGMKSGLYSVVDPAL